MLKAKDLSHSFSKYFVPSEWDYDDLYLWKDGTDKDDFVRLLMELCWEYAKKLSDYEKREIDDGK